MKTSYISILFFLALAAAYQQYCSCQCNTQQLVRPIDKCNGCTKEFCLEQDPKLCSYTESGAKEKPDEVPGPADIIISCYQIESLKEKLIIYSFASIVVASLAYSVVKQYI